MLLPRPARLLKQYPYLSCRPTTHQVHARVHTRQYAASATASRVSPSDDVEIDESYRPFLNDMRMQGDGAGGITGRDELRYRSEGRYRPAPIMVGEDGDEGDRYATEWEPREERRSPAAVLGSKRIGLVVLPEQLVDGIQEEINVSDPRDIRSTFLALNPTTSSPRSRSLSGGRARKASEEEQRQRSSAPAALAKAAAFLPGEFAAVRNVVREMKLRLGDEWLSSKRAAAGGVVEVSGSLGSGVWALADVLGHLEEDLVSELPAQGSSSTSAVSPSAAKAGEGFEYRYIHSSRAGVELAGRLFESLPESSIHVQTSRKLADSTSLAVSPVIAMSTFHLSALPTRSSRLQHLRALLASSPQHIVLIDRSTPDGWAAISEARAYMLGLPLPSLDKKTRRPQHASSAEAVEMGQPQSPGVGYHVLAPCPHDGVCPILASPSRDICSFSQRLQRPSFLRRTKHAQKGEEDMGYTYVVFSKGDRPVTPATQPHAAASDAIATDAQSGSRNGRIGGVGREELEKARSKVQGKSELREVEGGEYEMVSMADLAGGQMVLGTGTIGDNSMTEGVKVADVDLDALRREAYLWPRLVAPPIKRSGHVVMDVCSASGSIQRQTYAKSHSKQGYHDARKAAWGDLFPHSPKGKHVERERGVRKLAKMPVLDHFDALERDGRNTYATDTEAVDMEGWPTAELVPEHAPEGIDADNGADIATAADVITWRSNPRRDSDRSEGLDTTRGKGTPGTRRGFSSIARPRSSAILPLLSPGWPSRPFSSSSRIMSVHPPEQPKDSIPGSTSSTSGPARTSRPKVTIAELYSLMAAGTPITCLTAYDYPTALLSQHGDIDMCLVGDSLAQVCLGHDTTTRVTLDEMIHHASAVTRGAKTPFVFADLPFGSFEASVEQGVLSVIRMIKEAGVDGVKIEGGREILPLVRRLSDMGVAVMPHLGLQPQRATSLSGYKVQARASEGAADLYALVREMKDAGAFAVLLEAIPRKVAEYITKHVGILTIGIGAGKGTAGQVLVVSDVLGTYAGEGEWKAKFVRHYGQQRVQARESVRQFKDAVREGDFPALEEGYGMKKEEWDGFVRAMEGQGEGGKGQ